MVLSRAVLAPDVGAVFEYRGRRYRVRGWYRERQPVPVDDPWGDALDDILFEVQREVEGVRLESCLRHEATHVGGSGVGGCIAAISQIEVVGRAELSAATLKSEREGAIRNGRERRPVW